MGDRELKQNFLYHEILEKEFDADAFTAFCEERKGADIDLWTYEELAGCVNEFKKIHEFLPPKTSPKEELKVTEPEPVRSVQDSSYQVQCRQAVPTEFSGCDNILVEIVEPQVTKGGVFSSKKTAFIVQTSPFGWETLRTVEDFEWLRDTLENQYPLVYLPPSPPKRVRNSKGHDSLEKQKFYLRIFSNGIVRNQLLKTSEYLLAFLKESDLKDFAKIVKQGKKLKKPQHLHDFISLEGSLCCDASSKAEEYVAIKEYIAQGEVHKKKIKRHSDAFIEKLREASKELLEISLAFEKLEGLQSLVHSAPGNLPMYNALKITFEKWAEFEGQNTTLLQEYLSSFFKYKYKEMAPLRELIKERDAKAHAHSRTDLRLATKKEKLYATGNMASWGLSAEHLANKDLLKDKTLAFNKMLPEDTGELTRLKDEFAFLNRQALDQCNSLVEGNQRPESAHHIAMAGAFLNSVSNFKKIWTNLATVLSQIEEEFLN